MEKRKQVGYPADLDLSKYEVIFWAEGDCMDAPDAPIRIKSGQRLKVRGYEGIFNPFADIEQVRGKVCAIQYIAEGKRYFAVKEVVGIDELTGCLRMAYYNPQKTFVSLDAKAIEKLYFVDGVVE
jgi:hypothetical protein